MHGGYLFMYCYFYLVLSFVKRLRGISLERTLCKFW